MNEFLIKITVYSKNNHFFSIERNNTTSTHTVLQGKLVTNEVYKLLTTLYKKDQLVEIKTLLEDLFNSHEKSFTLYCRADYIRIVTHLTYVKSYTGLTNFKKSSGVTLVKKIN